MEKVRVCLSTPHFGPIEKGNADGVYAMATQRNDVAVHLASHGGSLLAYNHNQGWADCRREWGKFDWWCNIHADVCPEMWWLDTLIEEAERFNFDVLHVAIPIKDSRGLTSTAIGDMANEYGKVRRVTLAELHEIQETFTARDLVKAGWKLPDNPCMCCNTGLLLFRLGDKSNLAGRITRSIWKKFPGFTIKDKITTVTDDGEYDAQELDYDVDDDIVAYRLGDRKKLAIKDTVARVVPEDWGFGRWASQQGLRIGGTRKVKLLHVGPAGFSNAYVSGTWKTDEYFTATDKVA